jgi:hypothetical protein
VKRFSRSKLLLAVGLFFVLIGNFLPMRVSIPIVQTSYEIGPGDSSSESVDLPLSIFYGESVNVRVEFDSTATPDDCCVWALVNYQYPTKGVSETVIRLEGQREMSFIFGWENVRLIPFVVITSVANLVTLTGFGFLIILIVTILKPVIVNRFTEK